MKRKVNRVGTSTLTVSLPSKWAKNYNLKPGDELDVEEEDRVLRIYAQKEVGSTSKLLDTSCLDLMLLKRYLNTIYKEGSNEVRLKFDDSQIVVDVQKILQENLIGYEIVEQGKDYCLIKSISTGLESEFDSTLRRVFLLLITISKESLEAIKEGDLERLKSAGLLEHNNNRFTTFLRRILNKNGYKDYKKTTFVYHIVEQLEKVADEYKYMVDYIVNNKKAPKLSKEALRSYDRVNALVNMYVDLFYKYDKDRVIEFYHLKQELIKELYQLLSSKSGEDVIVAHHLIAITREVFDLLAPYLTLVI